MKSVYQVRIETSARRKFAETIPWGYHGDVIEALIGLIVDAAKKEGAVTATANLLDGRYTLEDKGEA